MSFVQYTNTRARKAPEALASAKDWQPAGRRLYLPLDAKAYGLDVREWKEDGRKRHAVSWKRKPYATLLLNEEQGAKDFAQVQVDTNSKGLAVQVDPANYTRVYVSIPAGAVDRFPEAPCMLNFKRGRGDVWTLRAKE